MPEALFRVPFYSAWQQTTQNAVAEVNKLDRRVFSDPALGAILQEIVEKCSLEVAQLNKQGIEGHARQQQAQANDGWGGVQTVAQGWIDVTIPFTGDADSFRVAPSRSAIPSHAIEIRNQQLVLSLLDDNSAEQTVQTLCTQISQNLDVLRTEYEQARPQLEQAVHQAADRRKAQIAAEGERDKTFSFPIRR